jgi:NADH:ubiquinone oxidoreductase subunit F (NADH-binding)
MENNTKIITRHWGEINPSKIQDYFSIGGYKALEKLISNMNPAEAIEEIKKSGLLGRGGAGFPMGEKLEAVAKNPDGEKYFICNLEESEPGTYKDRMIVDNNPHLLIEGIILCSLSVGTKHAYIYINGHYQKQAELLEVALIQAEQKGYLGKNISGSDYELEIELYSGAGAYITGEETALINSMEGNRGEPKIRPPYPVESGFFGKPTAVNNAETIANVPWIIENGGDKYAKIGSADSPGTKLYILSGAIKNPGVIEAPAGLSLKEIIEKFGGGIKEGKEFWFAQIGGACGHLLLEKELDTKLGFGNFCGCSLGSGSILVVDKSVNIHDLLISWTEFFRRESCGKCVPCREGTFRLYEIMKRFQDGKISDRDKIAARDILWTLENTTFCPFGKFAAVAVKDAINKLGIFDN